MNNARPVLPTRGERHLVTPDAIREVRFRYTHVASNVSLNWSWYNEKQGLVQWSFHNMDTRVHSVILLRNLYYFGGAFWPVYYANSNGRGDSASNPADNFGTDFLGGTAPVPFLVNNGVTENDPPLALVKFSSAGNETASENNSQVIFVFTLGPGETWSMIEGGFSANMIPSGISIYEVTEASSGFFCIGYDGKRVTDWDNQTGTKLQGYSPNPSSFNTWMMAAEPGAPFDELPYTDSYSKGKCGASP
ncbi:MAG: hypothetical protein QW597_04425 [Thermoplasmataceae archaeon]